jgi:hypothetical protein
MNKENVEEASLKERASSDLRRILCIVDSPNWIFSRHVAAFERYLGDEFRFSVAFRGQTYQEDDFDLIYPLEFNMVSPEQIKQPGKYVTAIRSYVSWADWDFLTLVNFLVTHFQRIHVVSKELFALFSPYIPGLSYVTHGVDTDFFSPTIPPSSETGCLQLGWAGNRNTIIKGFKEFIQPLSTLPGVKLVFHGIADRNLNYEEMREFYQSLDGYVCASSFEGNNNSLLEAAAMERAIVTTSVGTVPEYLKNNQSALIVDRDLEQFKSAVLRLRDNPELRIWLGQNARKALVDGGWAWKKKAEDYRDLFRSALTGEQEPATARITIDPVDPRHFADVLHTQFVLMRELRIGYASKCIDLERQVEDAQRQIIDIKGSKTYRLVERIKSIKIIQFFIKLNQQWRSKHPSI